MEHSEDALYLESNDMSLFSVKKPRGRQFRKKVVHTLDESDEGEQQDHVRNETDESENVPVQNVKKKEATVSTNKTKVCPWFT